MTFLHTVDLALYVAGGAVWLVALTVLVARRRDPLSDALVRPHWLTWIDVVWVILTYLLATMLASTAAGLLTREADDQELALDVVRACANAAAFTGAGVACAWLAGRRFHARYRGFGLITGRLGRDIAWSAFAFLAIWPLVAALLRLSEGAVSYLWGEDHLKDHRVIHALDNPDLPSWCAWLLIATAVVLAPVAEELFFRGILQTRLATSLHSRWAALLIASACFGFVHSDQYAAVVPLVAMGIILGYVYEATGSLVAPILIHAVFNAKSLIWHYLLQSQAA